MTRHTKAPEDFWPYRYTLLAYFPSLSRKVRLQERHYGTFATGAHTKLILTTFPTGDSINLEETRNSEAGATLA
jgi:hypothetical protein